MACAYEKTLLACLFYDGFVSCDIEWVEEYERCKSWVLFNDAVGYWVYIASVIDE